MAGWRLTVAFTLALSACAPGMRQQPAAPPDLYRTAEVAGYADIRFYGDEKPPFLPETTAELAQAARDNPALTRRIDLLALSGGGAGGAYGAGFLQGWTERGDRPEFTWVTGISTGALIAPFAFLGPQYDGAVRRLYTETSTPDLLRLNPVAVLFGADSVAQTDPLRRRIAEEMTPEIVARIAAEHARGRRLLIGTTNLDAERPVIWDIGRIASSDQPGKVDLIRKILLASASIPGAFPPVNFDVVIDGKRYQEMHVDGGVTQGIFAYPVPVDVPGMQRALRIRPEKNMWVIRNSKLAAEYAQVERGLPSIASRSVSTLLKYQGRGDIAALERLAQRDGFRFHLTGIPATFTIPAPTFFEQDYMVALYEQGLRDARAAQPWQDHFVADPD